MVSRALLLLNYLYLRLQMAHWVGSAGLAHRAESLVDASSKTVMAQGRVVLGRWKALLFGFLLQIGH